MVFRTETALKGLIVSFDESGGLVATVNTSDGRVKVFSTDTGALHVDLTKEARTSRDTATQLTCGCWSKANEKHLCIGTSDGAVIALDTSRAKKSWSAEAAIPGAVQSCCIDSHNGVMATGHQGEVVCLSPDDGAVKWRCTVTGQQLGCSAAASRADRLLVASTYLFVLRDQQVALKLSGHTAPVTCMAVSDDGEIVISGARGDRSLALFSCRPKDTAKDGAARVPTRKAKLSLSLPEAAASVVCCACSAPPRDGARTNGAAAAANADANGEANGAAAEEYVVAAVTEGGVARVWSCRREGKEWRGRLRRSIRVDAADRCVLAVAFAGPEVLLVAHGLPLQPCVQKVHVPRGGEGGAADGGDGDAAEEEEVVLAAGGGLLAPTDVPRKQAAQGAPAVGIGADNAGLPVATLSRKRAADASDAAPSGAAAADGHAIDGAREAEPLGVRVAKLFPELQGGEASGGAAAGEPITADSLTVLLTQAIQSGDKELLERVLSSGRGVTIPRTVQRLAAGPAVAFFHALVDRLQRTPARAAALLPWLRAALLHHAAALSASPAAQEAVARLGGLVRRRAEALQPVLALRGRLEVLLATASLRDGAGVEEFAPQVHVAASSLKPQSLKSVLEGRNASEDDADDASEGYQVEDPYNPQAGASSEDGSDGGESVDGDEEEEDSDEEEDSGSEDDGSEDGDGGGSEGHMDVDA